jgi:hypothetical protein
LDAIRAQRSSKAIGGNKVKYEYTVVRLDTITGQMVEIDGEAPADALGNPGLEDRPYLSTLGYEGWRFVARLTTNEDWTTILMERPVQEAD